MPERILDAAQRGDLAMLRRRLAALHDELRASGQNPLQALRSMARVLVGDGHGPPVDTYSSVAWAAFQEFLTTDLRGPFGQYLTPPPVAEHVANLVADHCRPATVLDPFLGSGVLLDAVANRVPGAELVGVEINDAVADVAHTALTLAGHTARISIADAFGEWEAGRLPAVDAVVTNPPFGASLVTRDADALARLLPPILTRLRRLPVELLALEMCLDVLRPDGFLIIVLPFSVFSNARRSAHRTYLLRRHTLMHLTTLPEETFAPYRGVANACVAVLRKTQPAPGPYEFGLAESISVGYDATGRPSGESDLSFLSSQAPGNRLSRRTVADSGTLTSGGGGPASPATCRLGDVADIFTGRNPARDSYVERGGAFLLKVGSLAGSFVSWKVRRRSLVPLDFFNSYPSKHLRPGDICLTSSAHRPSYIGLKVDLLSRIPLPGAIASNEVMVIRLRRDAPLSPVSLLYYLRSSAGRRSVQALVKGSTAHVYPRDVAELRIPLPDGRYDESTLVEMHSAAEDAFYRYIELEAEARALAGAKPPNDDEAN